MQQGGVQGFAAGRGAGGYSREGCRGLQQGGASCLGEWDRAIPEIYRLCMCACV